MEISSSSSSSSSLSSISSMTSNQSDIETILELVEALDLNPELFKAELYNSKTHLTKDYIVKYLKNYLETQKSKLDENEINQDDDVNNDNNNTIKLNELKTALLLEEPESESFKLICQDEQLPRNLLVTSMKNEVFTNMEIKLEFEKLFNDFKCKFCYLPSFKRCYIQFDNPIAAILARIQLHDELFLNETLKIFLNKVSQFLNYY